MTARGCRGCGSKLVVAAVSFGLLLEDAKASQGMLDVWLAKKILYSTQNGICITALCFAFIQVAMAALTNRDVFGIVRRRCKEEGCECAGYLVEAASLTTSAPQLKCGYCQHAPSTHGYLGTFGKWLSLSTGDWQGHI